MAKAAKKTEMFIDELDDKPSKDVKDYWQSVGQFVSNMSSLEACLRELAMKYCQMSAMSARLSIWSFTIGETVDLIRKAVTERKLEGKDIDHLKGILNHILTINTFRNVLIHFGSGPSHPIDGSNKRIRVASDREFSLKRRSFVASEEVFDNINKDLLEIMFMVMWHAGSLDSKKTDHPTQREFKVAIRKQARARPSSSWRYTPPSVPPH